MLAGLLLIFFSAYEYGRVLHLRPLPMHLWRQADCLALTLQYARDEGSFTEPSILGQIADKGTSGKSAGELPLIYFLMGKLWSITGPSEFIYRLFGLLLHVVGTFALFATVRRVVQSDFWAVTTALLFFTSPVMAYYAVGFLPDVPAFDLVLVGWYLMARFAAGRDHRYWYLAAFFFGLAMLLKVTAGMSLVALGLLLLLATLRPAWLGPERQLLPDVRQGWIGMILVVVAVLTWYVQARNFNDLHGGSYTFNGVWPIWTMSRAEVTEAWEFASDILVFQIFDTSVWILLGVAGVVLVVHRSLLPRALALLNVLLFLGVGIYVMLWYHALLFHDYYFINPQVALVVLWVSFLWILLKHHPDILGSRWARWSMCGLLALELGYVANNLQMRYNSGSAVDKASLLPLYHDAEPAYWNGVGYGPLKDLVSIGPFLGQKGVRPTDKVIFLDDYSINSSLYLMGRPGYTQYGWHFDQDSTMGYLVRAGARYLLFAEDGWLDSTRMRPYLRNPLGQHGRVRLFDLQGLDELVSDTVRMQGIGALARASVVDTAASHNGVIRFKGSARPFVWEQPVMLDPTSSSVELSIQGVFRVDGGVCSGHHLVFVERAGDHLLTYYAAPLAEGSFSLDLLLFPRGGGVQCTLYLENSTRQPFALEDLQVEMRYHRGAS